MWGNLYYWHLLLSNLYFRSCHTYSFFALPCLLNLFMNVLLQAGKIFTSNVQYAIWFMLIKNVFIRVSMHIFADYNRICDRWTIICDRWKLHLFVETLVFVQVRIKFKVHSNNHRVYVHIYSLEHFVNLIWFLNFFLLPVFLQTLTIWTT